MVLSYKRFKLVKNKNYMLKSLHIRNYRNLKDFKLEKVDQVNLITGKNNTGKSTLLEAILIYANRGSLLEIAEIVQSHGEYLNPYRSDNNEESEYRALSSIFNNRVAGYNNEDAISIGELKKDLFNQFITSEKTIVLKFIRYIDEEQKDSKGVIYKNRKILTEDFAEDDYKIAFAVILNDKIKQVFPLGNINFRRVGSAIRDFSDNIHFIKTGKIDRDLNGKLFDNLILTDKEKHVIEALKIIEPDTERIAFVEKGERQNERMPIIKLKDRKETYPLKSMGDGINRVLTIILALVNSEDGFLLIDEFENGLHYTAQEQLWRIIFKLSKDLNVQVFATTHSEDCISGFQRTLNNPQNNVSGRLIRLDNIDGVIKQTEFLSDELRIADEQDIEVR